LTVEMEASAVFAVGQIIGVETAAVFVISDLLKEKAWKSSTMSPSVISKLVRAFEPIKNALAERSLPPALVRH
jgi:purine-nucleoside phosphorylase